MSITKRGFKVWQLLFWVANLFCTPVLASEFTASAISSSWNQYLDSLKLIEFSSSFIDYYQAAPDDYNTFTLDWKVDFGSQRYWNGKSEKLHDDSKRLYESSFVDNRSVSVSLYTEKGKDEYDVVSYFKIPDGFWDDSLGLLYMAYPFGYINDNGKIRHLPEIMAKGKLNLIENAEGEKIGIESLTSHFDMKLYFLPEKNFATQQIVIKRLTESDSPFVFQECKYTVKKFLEIDGIWFPVEYDVKEKYGAGKRESPKLPKGIEFSIPDDGLFPARILMAKVSLTNVRFPKSFSERDFELNVKIPNGTPVTMYDVPQIKYVWMDGKPVVKTDEVALRIARGDHGFMPGPKNPRFWFMALGAILLLVGGGLKIRSMLKEG